MVDHGRPFFTSLARIAAAHSTAPGLSSLTPIAIAVITARLDSLLGPANSFTTHFMSFISETSKHTLPEAVGINFGTLFYHSRHRGILYP